MAGRPGKNTPPRSKSGGGANFLGGLLGGDVVAGADGKYVADHPIMDSIFNGGRNAATAQSQNFSRDMMLEGSNLQHKNAQELESQRHKNNLETENQRYAHNDSTLDKHFKNEREMIELRNRLQTEGYSKELAAQAKAEQDKFIRDRENILNNFMASGNFATREDALREYGRQQYHAHAAAAARDKNVIDTADSTTKRTNAQNDQQATEAIQKNQAATADPNIVKNNYKEVNRAQGVQNWNVENPLVHIAEGTGVFRSTPTTMEATMDKPVVVGKDGKPLIPRQDMQINRRLQIPSSKTPPPGNDFNLDQDGNPRTDLNGVQSSVFEGTNPHIQQNGTSQVPPPTMPHSKMNQPGDVDNQNMPSPIQGLLDSPFGQELQSMGGQLQSGYQTVKQGLGTAGSYIQDNMQGVDPIGNFKKTPIGAVLSKLFTR